jgi:hypothetical protein
VVQVDDPDQYSLGDASRLTARAVRQETRELVKQSQSAAVRQWNRIMGPRLNRVREDWRRSADAAKEDARRRSERTGRARRK